MLVDINKLSPNPYRDFDLYPYGEDQVAKLIESYERDGDWGVLPARPHPNQSNIYQIASGHHRLEAMRRLGFKAADVKVESFDDNQMLSLMISENATQRGQNAAATLDSVAAAMKRIAYLALSDGKPSGEFSRRFFTDGYSIGSVRGRLEAGRGIGRDLLARFPGMNAISKNEIKIALTTIKSSDLHMKIMQSVHEQIERETAEITYREQQLTAEKARLTEQGKLAEAKEVEKQAKAEAKNVAAAKERRGVSEKAVERTTEKTKELPVLFDAHISALFENDYQLELFRNVVTSGTLAKVLPQDRQYDLAKACIDWHKKNDLRLTEKGITNWLGSELDKFLKNERQISKRERDLAMRDSADLRIQKAYREILAALCEVSAACGILKEEYERYPTNSKPPVNTTIRSRLPDTIRDLTRLNERLAKMH